MHANLLRLALIAGSLAAAAASSGYEIIRNGSTRILWADGPIPVQIKLGSTPTLQDDSNYSTSAKAAMDAWNGVLRNVQFSPTIVAAGPAGEQNGINELVFASDVFGTAFEANVLAITTSFRSGSRRTQSDIVFNTAYTWNSYRGVRQSGVVDIRRVAIHELGHMLGLDHPDESGQAVSAVMNSRVSDIDAATRDDIDGAQYLYGVPGATVRPANDSFASATTVTIPASNTLTLTASSVNATKETGEPNHASEAGGTSIWWKWTATGTGTLEVSTAGTTFDTLLGAYTGTAVNALTLIASNDDAEPPPASGPDNPTRKRTSIISFPVTMGTTYYFAVDGWDGEWGSNVNLTFNLNAVIPDAAPTITTQPQSQSVTVGTNVVFSVVATGKPNPTYQWNKNGAAIAGATSTTYSITGAQTGDAGTYTVTVSNSIGNVTSSGATLTVNPVVTPPSGGGGGGGGGGGAPSHWFFAALALAALARWRQRRQ